MAQGKEEGKRQPSSFGGRPLGCGRSRFFRMGAGFCFPGTHPGSRPRVCSVLCEPGSEASLEESGEFVTVERDEQGEPLAVHADTTALNALRSQVLARLEDSLNGSVTVDVPAGSLTGIALLNGRGFPVPLKLRMEGSADLAFETEFGSAGINQSCHRITMVVTVQLYSQSQRFETQVHLETSTVLAETVLVGQVPQAAFLETG